MAATTAQLRAPTLALAALSIVLDAAVIGCAGRTLSFFNTQQSTNAWLLPLWPNHFDTRELHALVGTSAAILILNAILVASLVIRALRANFLVLAASLLSTVCSLIAVVFPALLNHHAPIRDTLQTWTCRWSSTPLAHGQGPPSFGALCHETRFAFYTTIPVLLLQLLLLGLAIQPLLGPSSRQQQQPSRLGSNDAEKSASQHELGRVGPGRGQSFETSKSESPRSQQGAEMGGSKAVQFA